MRPKPKSSPRPPRPAAPAPASPAPPPVPQRPDRGPRPAVFGELLYDHFPDGKAVLGGGPLNVAWHLQGFGRDPLLVTALGADEAGQRARKSLISWGMDLAAVQEHEELPTGAVEVQLGAEGAPGYTIPPEQAFDRIDPAAVAAPRSGLALLYHGTLALRSQEGWRAASALQKRLRVPLYLDLQLRPPWFELRRLRPLLQRARWLKLDLGELEALRGGALPGAVARAAALRELQQEHELEAVALTLGAEGALLATADALLQAPAPAAEPFVDSVGAGDAFVAVHLLGILAGWSPQRTLERAVAFASSTCSRRGATSPDASIYSAQRRLWDDQDLLDRA